MSSRPGVVAEDSPVGVAAGSHFDHNLRQAGAHSVITDMRALPCAVIDLRGW